MRHRLFKITSVFVCAVLWSGPVACSSSNKKPTTQPADAYERQDAAMHDPFGYSPLGEKPDISGGGIGELDHNAMKKDVDHVLNP